MRLWQRSHAKPLGSGPVIGVLLGIAILGHPAESPGGEPTGEVRAARERFFEQSVRPLLAENCYSCHGAKKQKGGLRLDSLEAILKGGESGPAVVPGKPAESLVVEAINYDGLEMPPTGKLAPEKAAVLSRWVSMGAPWPARDRAAAHATTVAGANPAGRFLPRRPSLVVVPAAPSPPRPRAVGE